MRLVSKVVKSYRIIKLVSTPLWSIISVGFLWNSAGNLVEFDESTRLDHFLRLMPRTGPWGTWPRLEGDASMVGVGYSLVGVLSLPNFAKINRKYLTIHRLIMYCLINAY